MHGPLRVVRQNESVLLRIGPVSSTAARAWTNHHLASLRALRSRLSELPFHLPLEVLEDFESLLGEWHDLAAPPEPFVWERDMNDFHLRTLVQYWANLDFLSDDQVGALGLAWSPPEAAPFFDALAVAVASALEGQGSEDGFAASLQDHDLRPT